MTLTAPEVGSISLLIIFRVVVFPLPEPPTIASTSPCETERSTEFTAGFCVSEPLREGNKFNRGNIHVL
jgi:hypothetical protein